MKITPIDLKVEYLQEKGHWPNGDDHTDRIGGHYENREYIEWLQTRILELLNINN